MRRSGSGSLTSLLHPLSNRTRRANSVDGGGGAPRGGGGVYAEAEDADATPAGDQYSTRIGDMKISGLSGKGRQDEEREIVQRIEEEHGIDLTYVTSLQGVLDDAGTPDAVKTSLSQQQQ